MIARKIKICAGDGAIVRSMIRSVAAVLAGITSLTVASLAIEAFADPMLMHLCPRTFPDAAALSRSIPAHIVMFGYTFAGVALGGYVTPWIARSAPTRHVIIMGIAEVGLTIWAMFVLPHQAPLWSWIAGMAFVVPAAWLGGAVCVKRSAPHRAQPANHIERSSE